MPLEGETAHHGGDVRELCVPLGSQKPPKRELFVPTGMHLDLLSVMVTKSFLVSKLNF
jgi:hypothetical protein